MKKSVQLAGPSPTATTSGVYTDVQGRPVAGFAAPCTANDVAMSSVIESWKPPTAHHAATRYAWFVPTNMPHASWFAARWITDWNR